MGNREHDHESAPVALSGTLHPDRASMQLDQRLDDREAQSQSAITARDRRITLPKAVEHEGQKLGLDTNAGVLDDDLDVRVHTLQNHLDSAARRRELHGVGEEIPQYLLQAVGVATNPADARIQKLVNADAPGFGALPDRVNRVVNDVMELQRLHLEMDLAGDDPAHIQQVVDDLGLSANVALDRLETALAILRAGPLLPQQRRPAL